MGEREVKGKVAYTLSTLYLVFTIDHYKFWALYTYTHAYVHTYIHTYNPHRNSPVSSEDIIKPVGA